jgi:hypothetical protein
MVERGLIQKNGNRKNAHDEILAQSADFLHAAHHKSGRSLDNVESSLKAYRIANALVDVKVGGLRYNSLATSSVQRCRLDQQVFYLSI